jgi:hemolysin activation/secretion protein
MALMKFSHLALFIFTSAGCAFAATAEVAPAPSAPAKAKKPVFTILEYQITGNSLLDARDIERTLEPFLGEGQSITNIEQAAKSLEKLYRNKGYPTVFVNIPEQDIRAGVVRMDIVEGKVQRLRITGASHHLLSDIRKGLPSVKEGEALNLPSFQQELAKVNARSQHLRVTPVLKPGKYPGSVEVELKVKDELPLVTQLAVNNHNSANTTRSRFEFNTAFNNLWQKDHGISAQFQTSPENTDEVSLFGLTYLLPGIESAHRLAIYAVRSDSQVASLGGQNAFTALGKGNIYGVRYIIPFPSTADFLHSLSLGFDYKDFADTLEIGANAATNNPAARVDLAPINYGIWGLDYDITRPHENGSDRYNIGVHFGLRGLNDDAEFAAKRPNAQPNFAYLSAGLKSTREFWHGWQGRGQFKTQLTDTLLIGNEQMASGGHDSVRGYFQSEAMGDQGFNASLELRTPSVFGARFSWLNEWRFLTFLDAGQVQIKQPAAEQIDHYTLASTGVGMRVRVFKKLSLAVDAAQALKDGSKTQAHDQRVDAEFRWEF